MMAWCIRIGRLGHYGQLPCALTDPKVRLASVLTNGDAKGEDGGDDVEARRV